MPLIFLSAPVVINYNFRYCGVGSFLAASHSNLLNVVFEAGPRFIPGNRFMCELSTVTPPTPAPPTTTTTTTPAPPNCSCGNRYKVSTTKH